MHGRCDNDLGTANARCQTTVLALLYLRLDFLPCSKLATILLLRLTFLILAFAKCYFVSSVHSLFEKSKGEEAFFHKQVVCDSMAQPGILFRRGQSPDVPPSVPSVYFRTVEIYIKHQRKILASLFRAGLWPLVLGCRFS